MISDDVTEVAMVLLRAWDPLRVGEIDAKPEQEYVFEAEHVVELLRAGASTGEVTDYLRGAAASLGPISEEA